MFSKILLLTSVLSMVQATAPPKCICYREILSDAIAVTEIEAPPDGSGRVFLCELIGVVLVLDNLDALLPEPFMNISDRVEVGNDRGLLALAFHPNYANNNRFYVLYSMDNNMPSARVSEFLTSSADPNKADMTSERVILQLPDFYPYHNGGDLVFGVDGMLYIALGDGNHGGDPSNEAQNKNTKAGSVLRIDVDSRTGNLEYGIPPDNPFLTDPEAADNPELYAYGFRNPWRMTMDLGDRTTQAGRGRIFLADVGEFESEEIDLLRSGGNYGWAAREGTECFKDMLNCPERPVCVTDESEVCPLLAYNHTIGQCIIGGHVYRGCVNIAYNGWYFFADYMLPKMYRMIESGFQVWEMAEVPTCASCSEDNFYGYPQTIGMDSNGELLLSCGWSDLIYRMYDPDYVDTPPCPLF